MTRHGNVYQLYPFKHKTCRSVWVCVSPGDLSADTVGSSTVTPPAPSTHEVEREKTQRSGGVDVVEGAKMNQAQGSQCKGLRRGHRAARKDHLCVALVPHARIICTWLCSDPEHEDQWT